MPSKQRPFKAFAHYPLILALAFTCADATANGGHRVTGVNRYDVAQKELPEWIPNLPGSTAVAKPIYYRKPDEERAGKYVISTKRKPDEVIKFYRDELIQSGFSVDPESELPFSWFSGTGMGSFTAHRENREVSVAVVQQKSESSPYVGISYAEKLNCPE